MLESAIAFGVAMLSAGCLGFWLGAWWTRRTTMRWFGPCLARAARRAVDEEMNSLRGVWAVPTLTEDRSASCHTDAPAATTRPDSPTCNRDG